MSGSPTSSNDQGTSVPADGEAMAIDKSDSSLIREYSKELVHALTLSKPARESLAIGLYAHNVLSNLEKQEIMNDSGSAMSLADKLVGYIIDRIDSQEHCDNIWKELHSVEASTDILKKIKSKGAAVSTVPLIPQPPGIHHSLTTNNSVESSTLTISSEPVSESMNQGSPTAVSTSEAATPRSDFSLPCQEIQPTSETTPNKQHTNEIVHYECPDAIVVEAMTLKGTYRSLVFGILEVLTDMVNNGEIKLANLAETINDSCGIEQYTFTGTETIDDVCSPITGNKNCFDPNLALLLEIDSAFCKRRFTKNIGSYRSQLRKFSKSTTIETFKEKVLEYESWNVPNNSTEIVVAIEVSHCYGKVAISQINYLKKFIFGENSSIIVMRDIHHSVLTITYSMPVEYFLPVLSTVIEKIDLLSIVGVLSITIGDVLLPIGEEITEEDLRICDLKQKQKRNGDIKKSIQNSQILQNMDSQQQALSLLGLQDKLESESDSQLTDEKDGSLKPIMSDSNNDESKSDVSETEQCLLQPTDQTEEELARNDQKIMSFPLQDQSVEGILAIKPDWDKYTIGDTSTSGIESEQGDIQDDLTLKEAILTYHNMKMKLLKESDNLKKELELQKEMRQKATMELDQMIGFRKIGKTLDESQEMTRFIETLEERDKEIMRMREEIKELQQETTLKHQLLRIDEQQELGSRLHTAAEEGDVSLVRHLIQLGANVNYRDRIKETPLHKASSSGHTEVVLILLSNGASIEAKNITLGNTPLHEASKDGHTEVVQILLSNRAPIEAKNIDGDTPLHLASNVCHTEVVQILLSNGASIEAMNNYGRTPLLIASIRGHTEGVQILLSNGALIEAKDSFGYTPLHTASHHGHTAVVHILLSNGASIEAMNNYQQSPLFAAIGCNRTNVAMLLISEKANIYGEDMYGQSPALMATVMRNVAVVKCLMSNGVEKETIDKYRLPSDWEVEHFYMSDKGRIIYKNKTTGKEQFSHPSYNDLDL